EQRNKGAAPAISEQYIDRKAQQIGAAAERLLRVIQAHPDGIKKGELIRAAKCTNRATAEVNDILDTLQSRGDIERCTGDEAPRGRPPEIYKPARPPEAAE